MVDINPSLREFLDNDTSLNGDLVRFCMSDASPHRLQEVISGYLSPVDYAKRIMADSYDLIFDRFFKDHLLRQDLPKAIVRSWVYESLIAAGLTLRSALVRFNGTPSIDNFKSMVQVYLLRINSARFDDTLYTGIASFSHIADDFLKNHIAIFQDPDVMPVRRLISEVSHIGDPTWILYDKCWQKVLFNNPTRLRAFRNFLHVAVCGYLVQDNDMEDIFEITKKDLRRLMKQFVAIRSCEHTDDEDIRIFISDLVMYFDDINVNQFFRATLAQPYSLFKSLYETYYATTETVAPPKPQVQPKISVSYSMPGKM